MDASAWDERYRGTELVWGAEPNRFLVEETAHLAVGRALDAACGEGRNALWLASQGWETTGVDFSEAGVARARSLADRAGLPVTFDVADLTAWQPPTRAFDLVLVAYLQLPGPVRRDVYRRLAGAVAPGGTMLVIGHDRANLTEGVGGPQRPEVLLDADEVATDLVELVVDTAEQRRRPVAVDGATRDAVDTVVRAHRVR
jgi:SAM-dependent methyltransferase